MVARRARHDRGAPPRITGSLVTPSKILKWTYDAESLVDHLRRHDLPLTFIAMRHTTLLLLSAVFVLACSSKSSTPTPAPPTPDAGPLKVGVTLHPYYSWVANVIAGVPNAEVVAVLPGETDAGNYQPSPNDIAKLAGLDAIVINGIGHDDFIRDMIKASGNTKLAVIEVNAETPLITSAHGEGKNSHTFISFSNAIQQSKLIARKLGELRPGSAAAFATNASAYGDKLRAIATAAQKQLANAKIKRVVTVHDGYSYLLQEMGVELAGVVQPAHGLTPSAKELGDMIALMKKDNLNVVLTEEDFPDKLLATLKDATHANVYIISHVAVGAYSPTEFETVMGKNADTLVKALVTDPK
jgi:zinc transport system substrate-binding protein